MAGVTVRYTDVRYATNGIELYGLPGHSPLTGEVGEDEGVGDPADSPETNGQVVPGSTPATGPQDIGNLFRSDRATISIAGTIQSLDDIDFYEMQIGYEATAGSLFQNSPVVFDVDYASGLSRPDTIVSVFDSFGRLVLIGRDSNITDDRGGALDEGDLSDLSRGSLGALDPFIGPVELPEATYFVAVTSNARVPSQLLGNPDIRLEPVNSITRVAEDHIGTSGGSTAGAPQVPVLLDQSSIIPELPSSLTVLILHDEGNPDEVVLSAAGLTSGVVSRTVGPYPGKVNDLATRNDGNTFAFSTPDEDPAPDDSTVGVLRGVNTSSPQYIASRDDGIETYLEDPVTAGVAIRANVGIRFHAMTYGILDGEERLLAVGSRGDVATPPSGPTRFTNLLYNFDPDTGQATSARSPTVSATCACSVPVRKSSNGDSWTRMSVEARADWSMASRSTITICTLCPTREACFWYTILSRRRPRWNTSETSFPTQAMSRRSRTTIRWPTPKISIKRSGHRISIRTSAT